MTELKVLLVDDSPFMRKVFGDVIDANAAFKVLATASDGEEAVNMALKLKPDIITMDLEMPKMNGIEALRKIMSARPTPVIMLSAVTDNGTRDTIRALQYGAIDFIRKPDGAVNLDIRQVGEMLLEKLRVAMETVNGGAWRMLPAVEEKAADDEAPAPSSAPSPAEERIGAEESRVDPPLAGTRIRKAENPAPVVPKPIPPSGAVKDARSLASPPARPEREGKAIAAPRPNEKAKEGTRKAIPPAASAGAELPAARRGAKRAAMPTPLPAADRGQARNPKPTANFSDIVAIGTSTGGPRALHEVLTGLPSDFPAPVLVVQHMPPKFTHSLAQRLDTFCGIRVREASDGELVETATAYIAPGGKHMTLGKDEAGKYRIRLSNEGPRNGHMPSVDVLFESLLGNRHLNRHVVLMTGMGSDGARGMKALRDDGARTTIAEAEQTCVVYGMPRSAVELGAADRQVPLQGIAPVLVQQMKARKT